MDFAKHLVASIFFIIMSVITSIAIFTSHGLTMILFIVIDIPFIFVAIYCLLSALTFKVGSIIEATIVDKESVDYNKGKNTLATYYNYTYEVTIKDNNRLGQFRLYDEDMSVIDSLNVGDTIKAHRLLNFVKVSTREIISNIDNK
jgi:hypothetical protein